MPQTTLPMHAVPRELLYKLLPFVLFDLVLKGFAMWKAARRGQSVWFLIMLIVSSLGILPAIYLLLNRSDVVPPVTVKTKTNSKKRK